MSLTKEDLPTPALLLDLDIFQANLEKMAQHAQKHGKSLRPHAKTHKCVQVAQRQIQVGVLGVCVATVPEAEVMVQGNIHDVLLTSPLATADKIGRMVHLAEKSPDLMVVVDHSRQVELYEEAAQSATRTLNVLVDRRQKNRGMPRAAGIGPRLDGGPIQEPEIQRFTGLLRILLPRYRFRTSTSSLP